MKTQLEELKQTWQELGEKDPLWAVASDPSKRGGNWDIAEFFQTGERDVAHYHDLLVKKGGTEANFAHVLDFGCGVGRLCSAWSKRATRVTGVDISRPMISHGKSFLEPLKNVELVVNEKSDLGCFPERSFDLIFSLVCLQHMPWSLASGYITEFARVCKPSGVVAFQLPARDLNENRAARYRQLIIENLPLGLGRAYRRWRHGSAEVFKMYYTPAEVVQELAGGCGLELLFREPDPSAGSGTEGYFYAFRKVA